MIHIGGQGRRLRGRVTSRGEHGVLRRRPGLTDGDRVRPPGAPGRQEAGALLQEQSEQLLSRQGGI